MTEAPAPAPGTDSDERARLQRHVRALASVNEQLHAQVERAGGVRRAGLGSEWLADLDDEVGGATARLVVVSGRVHVLDGQRLRTVRSGLLADALEHVLGPRERMLPEEAEALEEGPPIEVLEAPRGAPFVVIGGQRLPVRNLPLVHPVGSDESLRFAEGPEIDVHPSPSPRTASRRLAPLPTFLIIGAQKSATRWLRSNLGKHPEIYAAPSELEFFNDDGRFEEFGVSWYREQFAGWAGEEIVGEATPGYLMWWHQPEVVSRRIAEVVPDAQLLAILRNPIDRAYSAVIHHKRRERLDPKADVMTILRSKDPEDDKLGLISGGWYANSLRPFVRRFGTRVLVLLHEDIETEAASTYAKAVFHVGADPTFTPPDLARVVFSNQRGDRNHADADRPLTLEERVELYTHYRDDVARLEELIGRDLSAWDPEVAAAAAGGGAQGTPGVGDDESARRT